MTLKPAQNQSDQLRVACREVADMAYRIGLVAKQGAGVAEVMARAVLYMEVHHGSGLHALSRATPRLSGNAASPISLLQTRRGTLAARPDCLLTAAAEWIDAAGYLAGRFGAGWLALDNSGAEAIDLLEAEATRLCARGFVAVVYVTAGEGLRIAHAAPDGVNVAMQTGSGVREFMEGLHEQLSPDTAAATSGAQVVLLCGDGAAPVRGQVVSHASRMPSKDSAQARRRRWARAQGEGLLVEASLWHELEGHARDFLVPESQTTP